MDLITHTVKASTVKSGQEVAIPVTAGQSFLVRRYKGSSQLNLLNEKCPVGKKWSVRVIVEVTETDA